MFCIRTPEFPTSRWQRLVLLCIACLFAQPVIAGSPELKNLLPVAGQRGTEVDVRFFGNRLHDVSDVLFHTPGITAKDVAFEDDKVRATLVIADDAPLGEHQMRIVTRTGVSEMQTFQVIDQAIDKEDDENNDAFDQAQPLDTSKAMLGRITPEDIDYFTVEAKKGERLSVEIASMRLGRGMSDLHLSVLNDQRFELAAADDTTLLLQDPFVSLIVPEDGRYTIAVRDSAYEGNGNNWYLMNVGSFPRPTVAYPAGGQPGQTQRMLILGDPSGNFTQDVTLPAQENDDFRYFPERDGQAPPTGLKLRINHLTNVLEGPHPTHANMRKMESVPAEPVPVAFNGRITTAKEADFFKFSARKNQRLIIRCYANQIGSPLDPVINVFNGSDFKHIEGNDDHQGHPDSRMDWRAPEDGDYFVRVRDHRDRGGEDFVYRVEITTIEHGLRTYLNEYNRNDTQTRQAVAVPQGNRYATLIRVDRDRVNDQLALAIEGLPGGMSYTGWCPQGRVEMPVVFEAAADAPLGFATVDPIAQAPSDEKRGPVEGGMRHIVPVVQGNPNRTLYYGSDLTSLPVAVTEPAPFRVDAVEPVSPLVQSGRKKLRVDVRRDEGYTGEVRLYMLWRPPGIGAEGRIDVKPDQDHGYLEINAEGNAATQDWPITIIAYGLDIKGGSVWVSTQLFEVKVAEPYIKGGIDMAAAEQGDTVQVIVKLEHTQAWEGEAELKLHGLPAHASTEPVKITHGQEQAVFTVTTNDQTPPGQHKSLFCEIDIPINGEASTHRFGMGGTLRIDRPRKPQQAKEEQPKPEQNAQPPERQLSRLEQLRLEAEREAKQK